MPEEKTLRVKFETWRRLMELSLSLSLEDNQRLSIDKVIRWLLRHWDEHDGLDGLYILGSEVSTITAAGGEET